ncbi:hypothetical protein Ddc_03432 [Ditylenchus destructor]|nr:hypothetical protein Ddc_03432 [Ditylenchus destructor]
MWAACLSLSLHPPVKHILLSPTGCYSTILSSPLPNEFSCVRNTQLKMRHSTHYGCGINFAKKTIASTVVASGQPAATSFPAPSFTFLYEV